jgi:2,3-bisphosphoglycerate-independent phosphoglycerate mutase
MPLSARHILIILDGYGIAVNPKVSAIDHARKPYIDSLFAAWPHARLEASGRAVGLPRGQMGNSEVGHMNLGAGRVVYQDITRIDKSIEDGEFFENAVLVEAVDLALSRGTSLHLMGLFSDGGVHSHLDHVYALLELCRRRGSAPDTVHVHAFTDGRDTAPDGGAGFARAFEARAAEIGVGRIATVIGRYYAMDRDNRWARTQFAYDALTAEPGTFGAFPVESDAASGLEESYTAGVTDEFVMPFHVGDGGPGGYAERSRIRDDDVVVFFNFRADRARQLTHALCDESFAGFDRKPKRGLHYVTLTPYDATFPYPVAFPRVNLTNTLGEVMEANGRTQLRAAETEKYPHVTYFFSGGREHPFEGEERILVPSPKVATYDLQPEMSARPLADAVAAALRARRPDLVVLNFANPDMVGHTGVFEAAVRAVEAVDGCLETVVTAALSSGYSVQIIADHGNADHMINPDGTPHTAHTTALVPHLIIADGLRGVIRDGKLGDVAPTILHLLGIEQPAEMTGDVLVGA